MILSIKSVVYLIALTTILVGCGNKKVGENPLPREENASISPQVSEIRVMLPDTSYRSAAEIKYQIDIFADSAEGTLDYIGDMYATLPGSLTFRKGTFRNADFGGKVAGTPDTIIIDWVYETGIDTTRTAYGTWGGGTGWTGQPLYIEWDDSCIKKFRQSGSLTPEFGKKEIIVGGLSGEIYFLNFESGKESRTPINVGNPIKGTPSLDPTMNGNLYVGHGVPAHEPFGAVTINLYQHQVTHTFDRDNTSWRRWSAYDSSPLRVGQFLFRPGENNTIYKFNVAPGELTLHSRLRYRINGIAPGIESSMCVYLNYGFTCDSHGNIIALNLNNLKPIWLYKLGDDIDATPVLEIEDGKPYIYVGCEIDLQQSGEARFVKLDALTGERIWQTALEGNRVNIYEKHFDGGFYASALPGQGNCSHLIFSNCVRNTKGQNGELIAFNRSNGKIEYSLPLRYYAWSSPVGYINENNEMFILTGDTAGNLYLINGISGKIITTRKVGSNFESSPVVVGNSAVIGSRGKYIYKVSIH
ncbi:MAG: PQQ-binding-like beta-propeller repeat protein [Paramuribaculum sp.]|nr:PQQ-binding-like beta-propeller repeat protein [Paramuribaculum sp.]